MPVTHLIGAEQITGSVGGYGFVILQRFTEKSGFPCVLSEAVGREQNESCYTEKNIGIK